MKVISIDQSFTHTAWIIAELNDNNVIDIQDFGVVCSDKKLTKYERAEMTANELVKAVNKHKPDSLIIEQIAFGGVGNAAQDLAGLLFVILVALKRGTHLGYDDFSFVTATGAKKAFTGNGKATKKDMLDSVPQDALELLSQRYLKTKGLYDLADAYAFLVWLSKQ